MNNSDRPQNGTETNSDHSFDAINNELRSIRQFSSPEVLGSRAVDARKHPSHGVYISPNKPTIICLTVCCEKREPWLTTDRHHDLLLNVWQDKSHWVVGRYVLMPDHLHLFAAPQAAAVEFDSWVKYVKSQFTKRNKNTSCVWQTDHWDTRIRNRAHYEEKSIYMFNNPVRAGLVKNADDWKYKGVVHELRWE